MKEHEHYSPIMPYLVVDKAKDFINFTKAVFGATEQIIVPREDGSVMHGELRLGKAVVMFTEANETYEPFPAGICLIVKNVEEIYARAIKLGAVSLQETADREYGKSAGFQDSFGNKWWLMNPV